VRRGEIYFATNAYGSVPHRVVVVSRDELNQGDYVVVAPFTSKKFAERKDLPGCVPFYQGEQDGLVEDCVARADFIVTIEKIEIDHATGRLGVVDDERMRDIVRAIGYAMEANCEPE